MVVGARSCVLGAVHWVCAWSLGIGQWRHHVPTYCRDTSQNNQQFVHLLSLKYREHKLPYASPPRKRSSPWSALICLCRVALGSPPPPRFIYVKATLYVPDVGGIKKGLWSCHIIH
ncbi:hypothetical protein V8F06_010387 [Rhypophila decipiens]